MEDKTLDPKTMSLDDIKQVLADVSLKMQENERLIKEYREEREKERKKREIEREIENEKDEEQHYSEEKQEEDNLN